MPPASGRDRFRFSSSAKAADCTEAEETDTARRCIETGLTLRSNRTGQNSVSI